MEDKIGWKNRIYLQPKITFQIREGIGGAFNEIAGQALSATSNADKEYVLPYIGLIQRPDHGQELKD